MKKYKNITEFQRLRKSFDYYQRLKKRCFQLNLDMFMHIDKTSYHSKLQEQYGITQRIENLFKVVNKQLQNKDFENFINNQTILYKELAKLEIFFESNRKELKFILDYKKNKEAKQRS